MTEDMGMLGGAVWDVLTGEALREYCIKQNERLNAVRQERDELKDGYVKQLSNRISDLKAARAEHRRRRRYNQADHAKARLDACEWLRDALGAEMLKEVLRKAAEAPDAK